MQYVAYEMLLNVKIVIILKKKGEDLLGYASFPALYYANTASLVPRKKLASHFFSIEASKVLPKRGRG